MPRPDGFRTNREMQVDFASACSDVFNSALQRTFGEHVSPAFLNKPLKHLSMFAVRNVSCVTSGSMTREELEFTLFNYEQSVNSAALSAASQEVHDYYQAISQQVGSIVLRSGLVFSQLVPSNGVEGVYRATMKQGERHRTDTYSQRTRKSCLSAALALVEDVQAYVATDEFLDIQRTTRYKVGAPGELFHWIVVRHDSDLPLNGNESPRFIESHYNELKKQRESLQKILQKIGRSPAASSIRDIYWKQLIRIENAIERTELFLE